MKKKTIITALLALFALTISAQEDGKKKETAYYTEMGMLVKDHLTHEVVPNMKGDLLLATDSSFVDTLKIVGDDTQRGAIFKITKPGKYIVRFQAEGYVTKCVDVDAMKMHKREKYRMLPTVYMRKLPKKLEVELDEVVVKSTLLKFYMDGDTLVYNADAFNMAEGSMMGDLIKKMPGVELESGGVIKVNGRKVESMLLNGKDFFDKDRELLLENMPSYMVKSFNVYERIPDAVRGTVREKSAQKEFVMDVRLKKDYQAGWIANAEAGGGATFFDNADGKKDGKHIGRLFGLRFTDKSRLVAYVNANNLNDTRKPGEQGDWEQLHQSNGLTSIVKGGLNYRYEQDYGLPKRIVYEGSVDGSYTDLDNQSQTTSATFLDNGNTFGKSFSNNRSYNWELNTQHRFMYNQERVGDLLKDFSIIFSPSFRYQEWSNRSANGGVTLSDDVAHRLGKEWMDSISAPNAGYLLKRHAINRTLSSKRGNGYHRTLAGTGTTYLNPAYNDFIRFEINFNAFTTDRSDDSYEHYRLDYPRDDTQPVDFRNRYMPTRHKEQNLNVSPGMTLVVKEGNGYGANLIFGYGFRYNHTDSNNPIYLLNNLEGWSQPNSQPLGMLPSAEEMLLAMDRGNSSHTVGTTLAHAPSVTYDAWKRSNTTTQMWRATLGINFNHERQNYQQGTRIDTLTRRNTALINGNVMYLYNFQQNKHYFMVDYNIKASAPSMTSLLNVRNDSDPLNITLGNPNLKNTLTNTLQFNYGGRLGKSLFHTSIVGNISTNAVAYGFIYDQETGVRTTKPQNVNGNWQMNANGNISLPLDKHDKLRLSENLDYRYTHSVDLVGTNAAMEATRSTVGSNYLTERLMLQYRPNSKMEFAINGSLTYQHSNSNRESFETLNVYTYNYGASAQIELPWNFQLSTDLTLYSRRGYSESSMNTNELVWNARLSKTLMKGNLTLMFDGFDLLGNLSNVVRTINAQGRTETFNNVIPSYGLFHVVYRLNKQPKNKKG